MSIYDQQKALGAPTGLQDQPAGEAPRENIEAVDAALRETYRYLNGRAVALNAAPPQVTRNFYLGGSVKLDSLKQGDYTARYRRKTIGGTDYFTEVSLSLRALGGQNIVVEKNTPPQIQSMRDFLWERNLRFECREIKNQRGFLERAVFTVMSEVPASATFVGDWRNGKIRLTLKNIDKLGPVDYVYDAAELGQALFDEFSKFLLGQPNNFQNLGKHQETVRATPRPQSATRETVYPTVDPTPAAEPATDPKSGLLGTLKSLFKR